METEGSLRHSQLPAICPDPEPARSNPYSWLQLKGNYPIHGPNIPSTKSHVLSLYQIISPSLRLSLQMICNRMRFYSEELLAPRPAPKLEDHPLSPVRDCLFNIFASTLRTGDRSSIRNLRTHLAVVTGTHLSHMGLMN